MATERYLLGEMAGPELDDFEEHMFVCLECAAAVKSGATFTENARAVFRDHPELSKADVPGKKRENLVERPVSFWNWFSFPQWATSFAAFGLLCFSIYQQTVISGLRAPGSPEVFTLAAASRGGEGERVIPANVSLFSINLDSLAAECAQSGCVATIQDSTGHTLAADIGLSLSSDRTAAIDRLTRAVFSTGSYVVVVQTKGQKREEAGRYSFRVE